MWFEQVSILQNKISNNYRYFHKFCLNIIDTSTILFEQYRYFKNVVRTVSILQKVSSFTALVGIHKKEDIISHA